MRCSRAASTDRCCLRHSGTSRFTRAQFTLPPRLKRSCVLCPRLLIQIESIEDQGFAFCGENTTVRLAPATVARYVEYIRNVQLTGAHQFANVSVYGQVLYPCSTSFAVCRRLCCQGCFVRPFKLSFQNDAIAANDCGQPSPRTSGSGQSAAIGTLGFRQWRVSPTSALESLAKSAACKSRKCSQRLY
jgi:hypothetical protein